MPRLLYTSTYLIGGSVGPRANLDVVEKGNLPLLGFVHYGELHYLFGIKLLYKCHDIQRGARGSIVG
jgi:hypothetical protein